MSSSDASYSLVDSIESLISFLEAMKGVSRRASPCISVDLEGVRLSRYGTVSLITIFDQVPNQVYLVDVHTLKATAFTTSLPPDTETPPEASWTLKTVLESPAITKIFFDVRNDSDALFSHFGIRLEGVEDVQLMECADRPPRRRRFVSGLQKCIEKFAPLTSAQKMQSKAIKEFGVKAFDPKQGGLYEYLPSLRNLFWGRLDSSWRDKVAAATKARIVLSQNADYQPHSNDNAFSPWRFE
ncbi:ribonuclease H-like domain-containing protein [Microdochium trichocladiopsis]|uniref:Ribonuclease H-like domain-containing protein n=1 Tax=Microdochium trichocladiopsis TaxID=1682393 RepID=A0A9P9BFL4_9PEZI|nr:ribonuclease H-like domain-containing protein [Microdochium trichocladiopsis]KAH7012270.1 ribonuclease H-like domain-containing protein [Microdochium trichocladiopsis]